MARWATLFQNTFRWGNVKIWFKTFAFQLFWRVTKLLVSLWEDFYFYRKRFFLQFFYCELATAVIKLLMKNQLWDFFSFFLFSSFLSVCLSVCYQDLPDEANTFFSNFKLSKSFSFQSVKNKIVLIY